MSKFAKIIAAIKYPSYGLYLLARRYVFRYEGFSFRFEKNGEAYLIRALEGKGSLLFLMLERMLGIGLVARLYPSKMPRSTPLS